MPDAASPLDPRVSAGTRRQLETWRARLAAGEGRLGWKIGLNPPAVMERVGIARPVVGHLTSLSRVASGGAHSLAGATNPMVEPEVAIEVGEPFGPGARIASLAAALEVVDLDRAPDDLEDVVATNIFHRAVALGVPAGTSLQEATAVVALNGQEVHRFDAAPAAGDLEQVVAVVAETLAACGEQIQAGDRIIAGSLTPPLRVSPGDTVSLELGSLGRAELRLVA